MAFISISLIIIIYSIQLSEVKCEPVINHHDLENVTTDTKFDDASEMENEGITSTKDENEWVRRVERAAPAQKDKSKTKSNKGSFKTKDKDKDEDDAKVKSDKQTDPTKKDNKVAVAKKPGKPANSFTEIYQNIAGKLSQIISDPTKIGKLIDFKKSKLIKSKIKKWVSTENLRKLMKWAEKRLDGDTFTTIMQGSSTAALLYISLYTMYCQYDQTCGQAEVTGVQQMDEEQIGFVDENQNYYDHNLDQLANYSNRLSASIITCLICILISIIIDIQHI